MPDQKQSGHDLPEGVIHVDATPENANWLRQSWSLQGTPQQQADMIAGPRGTSRAEAQEHVNNLMRVPLGRYLPDEVKAELERRGLVVPPFRLP